MSRQFSIAALDIAVALSMHGNEDSVLWAPRKGTTSYVLKESSALDLSQVVFEALAVGLNEVIAKSELANELRPILERMIVGDLGRQITPESNVNGSMLR